jgi:3'-phosphoadenosine 5'-phosphosulfate sulfotransferase (PAPS reductase)/FAD synthetase
VSNRTVRLRGGQHEILPGLPDGTPSAPPKADEYQALTLDQVIDRAHRILDVALGGATVTGKSGPRQLAAPDEVFTLFSGGGDSSILAHLLRGRGYPMVHIRTGISIPATWTYVQAVAAAWGLPLLDVHPDDTYEDLILGRVLARTGPNKGRVVWKGFPGPAAHFLMYQRLKERALEKLRRDAIGRYTTKTGARRVNGRPGQLLFLAGMRWGESDRRFLNASEYDPWGSVLWVSPLVWWTNGHMREYRDRYMCSDNHEHAAHRLCHVGALPLSVVSEHLHASGDCCCGAFARPGELEEIAFFWPEVAARIRALAAQAEAAGLDRCIWGEGKRPKERAPKRAGKLCKKCVPQAGQMDVADSWLAQGLIEPKLHSLLTGQASS